MCFEGALIGFGHPSFALALQISAVTSTLVSRAQKVGPSVHMCIPLPLSSPTLFEPPSSHLGPGALDEH